MKLTKGMKIFWIFIAVGLVFSMIMVVAGDNPFLFSNYQLEKEFDEEYIGEMADVILSVVPGSTADEMNDAVKRVCDRNMIVVSSVDYSSLPDDETQFSHYVPYYDTVTMAGMKDNYPINNLHAEFYNDELAVVTYRLNTYSSRADNGRKSLWRQQQIMSGLSESLAAAGYKKVDDIKYYEWESSLNVNGAGFGWVEKNNAIYSGSPVFSLFYSGYLLFTDYSEESDNMLSYYMSPDEENIIAVIPKDLCGDEECLYSRGSHRDDRYAEVYVICYNKDIITKLKDDGADIVNHYSPADSVENFILIDKMGAEEFCNTYERER
ncbi:MAG: hypothetical protein IKM61_07260 [Eubacteriaceae bacterium]|nr:hypothetical protein [Eubacteriaceae bacterium]